MRPRHFIAIVLVIAGTLALNATRVWAHSTAATFGDAACLSGDGWEATLHITATNPELHPVAHIATSASSYDPPVPAAGYTKQITSDSPSQTVSVVVSWSDGFTKDLGSFTAHRPSGCTPATSTPPTTTCAEAIPVRDDCGGATTVPTTAPVATTAPPAPDTTVPPVITAPPAPVVRQQVPVSHPKIALPPTCLKQANCAHVESIPEPAPAEHLGVGSALAIFVIAVLGFGWLIMWDRRRPKGTR